MPSTQRSISRSPGAIERAHPLAQHLDARARDGVDARVAQGRERAVEAEPAAVGEVPDVLRPVGVQVHAGGRGLHGPRDVEVCARVLVDGEEPLHADLRGAEVGGIVAIAATSSSVNVPGSPGGVRAEARSR